MKEKYLELLQIEDWVCFCENGCPTKCHLAIIRKIDLEEQTIEIRVVDKSQDILIDTDSKWSNIALPQIEAKLLSKMGFLPKEKSPKAYGNTVSQWELTKTSRQWVLEHAQMGGWSLVLNEKIDGELSLVWEKSNIGFLYEIQHCLRNPEMMCNTTN